MFGTEGRLYRICTWIYYFALLNMIFLISCIPIITIYPATAALFGVVRQWRRGNEPSIFNKYRILFAENFKQSLIVGTALTAVGLFLIADFYLLTRVQTGLNMFLFIGLGFVSILLFCSTVYIFPLMVNDYYSSKQLVITALKFALYKPHLTLFNLIALGLWLDISVRFTFFLAFFFPSVAAFITYWFAELKIAKLAEKDQ